MPKKNKPGPVRSTYLPHLQYVGTVYLMVRSYVESLVPFGRCKCRYRNYDFTIILKQHIRNFEASRVHITGFSQHAFLKDKGSSKCDVHIQVHCTVHKNHRLFSTCLSQSPRFFVAFLHMNYKFLA
jgi:hypothetical protein